MTAVEDPEEGRRGLLGTDLGELGHRAFKGS